jgi:hypothetical protein
MPASAEEYREFMEECLRWARTTRSEKHREALIEMANAAGTKARTDREPRARGGVRKVVAHSFERTSERPLPRSSVATIRVHSGADVTTRPESSSIHVAYTKCDWRATFSRRELIASHGLMHRCRTRAAGPGATGLRAPRHDVGSLRRALRRCDRRSVMPSAFAKRPRDALSGPASGVHAANQLVPFRHVRRPTRHRTHPGDDERQRANANHH